MLGAREQPGVKVAPPELEGHMLVFSDDPLGGSFLPLPLPQGLLSLGSDGGSRESWKRRISLIARFL